MSPQFDWKFAATLFAALAGVVVPIWLWQADINSKAIELHVVSSTELRLQGSASLEGMEVTVDGKSLEKPYITVLQLRNAGSRPISSTDFESPIELTTKGNAELAKASVSLNFPPDLKPKLDVSAKAILIQPLLLNPQDGFQFTILTSGGEPEFSPRSRISGIQSIALSKGPSARELRRQWARTVVGVLLLVMYFSSALDLARSVRVRQPRAAHLVKAVVACVGAILLLGPSGGSEQMQLFEIMKYFGVASLLFAVLYLYRTFKSQSAA